jgi:hypothetical protein
MRGTFRSSRSRAIYLCVIAVRRRGTGLPQVRLLAMRVLEYCHASAVEAVNKANDPTLPNEARVEWARIAKVWQDITQHYDLIEDLGAVVRIGEGGPGPNDTVH